jgi:adenosylcobinamide kinase/adenosylcobinamide-phosphate guanylyltransferase
LTAPRTYLVLGGARSGKTRHAMRLATARPRRIYIATAEARDDEMRERIARHQQERDGTWSTVEEPTDLAAAIAANDADDISIMVDCLTLWLSNLMAAERDVHAATADLIVFVSNEVGLGIVPANALARAFRDAQGSLNQAVASAVDHVDFIAAGLALNMKPGLPSGQTA